MSRWEAFKVRGSQDAFFVEEAFRRSNVGLLEHWGVLRGVERGWPREGVVFGVIRRTVLASVIRGTGQEGL